MEVPADVPPSAKYPKLTSYLIAAKRGVLRFFYQLIKNTSTLTPLLTV
jgi:hypothetical protein